MNEGNNEKATFIVEVEFDNETGWRGTAKWVQKNKILSFKNASELLQIIGEPKLCNGERSKTEER